jgi:hypothetical protein
MTKTNYLRCVDASVCDVDVLRESWGFCWRLSPMDHQWRLHLILEKNGQVMAFCLEKDILILPFLALN